MNQDDAESGQSHKIAGKRSCCDPDSKAQLSEGIVRMFKDRASEESVTNLKEPVEKQEEGIIRQNFEFQPLREGNYFGEIGLLTNLKRTATVTTSEYSTISCLSRKDLYNSKNDYPIIYQ